MTDETGKGSSEGKAERGAAASRAERLAAAMRENARKRKAQARARAALEATGETPARRDVEEA